MLPECGPRQILGQSRVDPEVSLMTAVTEENVTKVVLICSQEMAIRAQTLKPADNIERD